MKEPGPLFLFTSLLNILISKLPINVFHSLCTPEYFKHLRVHFPLYFLSISMNEANPLFISVLHNILINVFVNWNLDQANFFSKTIQNSPFIYFAWNIKSVLYYSQYNSSTRSRYKINAFHLFPRKRQQIERALKVIE